MRLQAYPFVTCRTVAAFVWHTCRTRTRPGLLVTLRSTIIESPPAPLVLLHLKSGSVVKFT